MKVTPTHDNIIDFKLIGYDSDELLVDLTYCVFDDKIYCERHYAENLRPRCGACDELIFSGQYTKALSKDFHCNHFCCWHCDTVLTGQRFVT